jgi:hypothetical protein
MSDETAALSLLEFLTDVGDAPEVIWAAAIAMLRRATGEAEEGRFGRFRSSPEVQLRRLREDLARGLKLARLAAAMQEAYIERDHELADDLHAQAVAAGSARRRAQTLPAQLARLENQKRRRAGLSNVVATPGWQEAAAEAVRRGEPPPPVA